MVKDYRKQLQAQPREEEITSLPTAKRGRPLLLGDKLDDAVIQHVTSIRDEGGVITSTILLATARGIIKDTNTGLLAELWWPPGHLQDLGQVHSHPHGLGEAQGHQGSTQSPGQL